MSNPFGRGSYRPQRLRHADNHVYESRRARRGIKYAQELETQKRDEENFRALVSAGVLPAPEYAPHFSAGGRGSLTGKAFAVGSALLMLGALGAVVTHDSGNAAAQEVYPTPEKIVEETATIEKIEISPSGDRLVYASGSDLKEFKIDSGSKELVESNSLEGSSKSLIGKRFTFTESGDLVYAVITLHDNGSQISGEIKEKSDAGIETLVSTSGNEALSLGGIAGGKLFYVKDIYDSSGLKESAIFSKEGSAAPAKVLSLSGSHGTKVDEVKVNKDGTKILFTEGSELKSVNLDGTSVNIVASSPIDFALGYGKVAFSHETSSPGCGGDTEREVGISDESGSDTQFFEPTEVCTHNYRDVEWRSEKSISYIYSGTSINSRGTNPDDETGTLLEFGNIKDHLWFEKKLFFISDGSIYVVDFSKFNHPPELRSPPGIDIRSPSAHFDAFVGRSFHTRIGGYDADEDPLSFSAKPPLLNVNPQTGEIDWTPTAKDVGMKAVDVCVSDGKASDCSQMRIRVSLPTQRFALPFYDNFDEQQRQGQDGSDRWTVGGNSSHWPRIVDGRYRVDGSVETGLFDYLTDYLFSMKFSGGSLKPGKSFDLVFGIGLGSSRTVRFERGLDGGLTIYPDQLSPVEYPNGTIAKLPAGIRLPDPLTNEKSYHVGLAVSRLRERVYFDGIQILRIDNERSPAGNIQIAGSGLLIDDVSITAWKNSPPTANLPASLALQKGKQTPFRFEASDPDGDPVTTEVETDGLANITKVSERDFRIKPLSRISAVQVRLSDGEGEANYSVRANVIAPATQQSWVGSLPLIGYLTAALLGSAGAVYVIRRLRKSSRPSGQIPEVAARPSAFGYPPPYFAHPGAQFADTRRPQPPPFQYAQPPFRQPGGSPPLRRGPRIVRDLNEKRE